MEFEIWQTAKREWRRHGWEDTGKLLSPTSWEIQRKEKHGPAIWLPDWLMPQLMLVLSSSCVLPCWDRLPKSHLKRKGRYDDGSNVSINNLGKLEVLHKHNCDLFSRRKCWALQHWTGKGRKVPWGALVVFACLFCIPITHAYSLFPSLSLSVLCQEAAQNSSACVLVPCPFLHYLWSAQFLEALSVV